MSITAVFATTTIAIEKTVQDLHSISRTKWQEEAANQGSQEGATISPASEHKHTEVTHTQDTRLDTSRKRQERLKRWGKRALANSLLEYKHHSSC
jgi:hypothetical protein